MKLYCVKGKHSFEATAPSIVRLGKRKAAKANCPKHGTLSYRFMAG